MPAELTANTTLSHYRIVSKLGAGGMGEVWLAEDTRLGRKVALKLLPTELTEDSERVRRFTLEAKAASALNHPNIISVYDIGDSETGRFIVMEFVAGRTLRAVIAKDNSLETLFTLGTQMARALSAAHAAGITHRDIKPDNIMVRDDGYVKMLDFGLARLLPTTASDPEAMTLAQQTTPGTVMGTLAYMSPEQASGQTVGSPSDVFALGIVLYELATGSHPFKSETMIGYVHAITSQVPPPLTSLKSHLPPALDDLILRMLEKDAYDRPTANEVAQALPEIEKYGSSNTLPLRVVAEKPIVSGAEEGFWVAVLPFKYRGNNADLEALAEGLSEDIITGLSRFSCLRVIARGSTLRFTSENADVRSIGKQLGARYVMEGSLRQAGSMLRLVVQLVDATTGAHLWAETYDRTVDADKIFALQDEIVPRIVSTVADWYGVLTHSMSEAVRLKPIDQVTPYEAVLRSFGYYERVTTEEHAAARSALERAVEQAPGNADGWAMLSMMYGEEFRFGFNEQPDPMGRSLRAARRAVDIAPSNHFAYLALAQALFFRKEFDRFRHAAERAIALNPMDGSTMEYVSHLIAFSGDWDYGCEVAERARQLNPNHPGWYWAVPFYNAYRNGDYPTARAFALKIDQPTVDLCQVMLAAVYGQLGEHEAADKTVQTLLSLTPDTAVTRKQLDKWYQPELVEKLIDGLRKAGLNIDEQAAPALPSASSTEIRSSDGFWIAVLPFKFTGSNAEIATLADGLSEEIVTGLSRFSYLRVISRSSTLRYANDASDIRTMGKTLGARYVIEGSLRLAGSLLRLSVQLIDATNGAHLWAETYDRHFQPDQIFAMQDELIPRIVSTCADHFGVLARSISDAVRGKVAGQLTPYEALMRGFGYHHRLTPGEHAEARKVLERAVAEAPTNADCWAMLSWIYSHEYGHGFNIQPNSLDRALAAAQRAVELAPSNHLAYQTLAVALFFRKEIPACLSAAERALTLNPLDASNEAMFLISFTGDWERGCSLISRSMELNPYHPGWYRLILGMNEYRKANYRGALDETVKANVPGVFWTNVLLAAAYGQLGEYESARNAVKNLLIQKEDFAESAREILAKWYDADFVEHLLDGLSKAGLEIAGLETSVSTTEPRKSIAVLPFTNLSVNPENEYFCDGLAEELLNALSKIDQLKVAARTSTFSFKGKNVPVSEIAKALNVDTIMEGSVRKSGNRVRITAQVINAADGYHLWSERYDREMKDIFDVQDEITLAVVDALKVKLFGQEQAAVLKRHTRNPEAHEFYLRGLSYFMKWTPEFFKKGIRSFEQAIEIDPHYASAYAGLAECYTELSFFATAREWMPKAREAARQALELDDTLGNAHNSLAVIKMYYDRDYAGAEHEFKRAISLDPGSAHIHNWYGWYLGLMGRFDESSEEMKRAQELDPLSALIDFGIGAIFHWSRKPEQAIEHYQRVLELNPNFHIAYWFLADAYIEKGDFASAIATIEDAPIALNDPITLSTAAHAYGKAGERRKALEILSELEGQSSQEYEPAFHSAQIYLGLGDHEQALACLEKACDERSVWLIWLGVDPKYDPLRSDPRFENLLRRVGLPHNLDNNK